VAIAVPWQPSEFVTVSVYCPCTRLVIEEVVAPVLHRNVQPEPVLELAEPVTLLGQFGFTVERDGAGAAFTVTVVEAVAEQPLLAVTVTV
jgi:hypothetical protein